MKEEYDIKNLNPRKNPYAEKLNKQMPVDSKTIDDCKRKSEETRNTVSDSH